MDGRSSAHLDKARSLAPAPSIAAVQGGDSDAIQGFLASLAQSWRSRGLVVAGVVEECVLKARDGREKTALRDLVSSALFPLKQDLGSGSTSCSLDLQGLAAAACSVETAIEAGCDCVILSKFGKIEAQGGGLIGAFYAAIAGGRPIVTSVSPSVGEAWSAFAHPLFRFIEPDSGAVESWRLALTRSSLIGAPGIE